jgi:hypothetical protein
MTTAQPHKVGGYFSARRVNEAGKSFSDGFFSSVYGSLVIHFAPATTTRARNQCKVRMDYRAELIRRLRRDGWREA